MVWPQNLFLERVTSEVIIGFPSVHECVTTAPPILLVLASRLANADIVLIDDV